MNVLAHLLNFILSLLLLSATPEPTPTPVETTPVPPPVVVSAATATPTPAPVVSTPVPPPPPPPPPPPTPAPIPLCATTIAYTPVPGLAASAEWAAQRWAEYEGCRRVVFPGTRQIRFGTFEECWGAGGCEFKGGDIVVADPAVDQRTAVLHEMGHAVLNTNDHNSGPCIMITACYQANYPFQSVYN